MIETRRALDQLDDILAVPGIDAVYVGPADLSITLGLPPRMDERRRVRRGAPSHREGVQEATASIAGIHANASLAARHEAAGYRMITIADDVGGMAAEAARQLAIARGEAGPASSAPVV